MRRSRKVFLLALVLGIVYWLIDALFFVLNHPGVGAMQAFAFGDMGYRLACRTIILALFVVFGFYLSSEMDRCARIRDDLSKANQAYDLLSACNKLIVRGTDENQLIQEICDLIVENLSCGVVWVELVRETENELFGPVAASGISAELVDELPGEFSVSNPDSVALNVLRSRELAVRDGPEGLSYIGVPMVTGEEVLGVLGILCKREFFQDNQRVDLFEELGEDLAFGVRAIETRRENRKIRESLREKERNMLLLLSNLPGIAYRCSNTRSRTMSFVSEGAEDLTGYSPDELVDDRRIGYGELIHPDDLEEVWTGIQEAIRARQPFELEYRIQPAGDEVKWVWEKGRGYFSESGELINIQGFITDITDRKQAKARLEESEQRFRTVLNNFPFGVFLHDRDGEIEMVNRAACDNTGYSESDLLSLELTDVDVDYDLAEFRNEVWNDLDSGEFVQFISTHRRRSGETYPAEVTVTPVWLEGERMILTMAQDITERREMERRHRRSEQRYRRLFETSPDGILIVDAESGRILDANPYVQELLNCSAEDLEDKKFDEPEELEVIVEEIGGLEALRDSGYLREESITLENGDDSPVHIEFISHLYSAGDQEVIQCNFRNVTRREEAQRELERLVEEKEILLHEVHHRVKNNLFTIVSLLELQREKAQSPAVRKSFQQAINRVHTMALIHKEIYSEESDQHLDFASYLRSLVEELISAQVSPDQDVEIDFDLEKISLDMEKALPCALAVNELITNAIGHGFSEAPGGKLKVSLCHEAGYVSVVVSDDGAGLPENFDVEANANLGLRMVRRWIEGQLQGKLEYESNEFTNFVIKFPDGSEQTFTPGPGS